MVKEKAGGEHAAIRHVAHHRDHNQLKQAALDQQAAQSAPRSSFKDFLAETDAVTKKANEERRVQAGFSARSIDNGVASLKLDPAESRRDDDDTSHHRQDGQLASDDHPALSLEDRILNGDEQHRAALQSLILRCLSKTQGELLLSIGPHNLARSSLSALLDHTDESISTDDFQFPKERVGRIVDAFKAVGKDIKADVNLLYNPYNDDGSYKSIQGSKGTEVPSSANDEPTTNRWRSKSIRLLVRRIPDSAEDLSECRIAVVGNVDAGKSSLLGVLTKGRLDDGRGRARTAMLKHRHEIETGRTSSVGMELLGFSSEGTEVLPEGLDVNEHTALAKHQQMSWEEISARSSKVISFADLAGHEKYLKTTLFGLTATLPDFVLLIIGGNAGGLIGMSKEHLSVALALSVPIVCVVTKVDMTPPNILEQTVKQLAKVLRSPGCRKQPVFVKDIGMACELATGFIKAKACPIFMCSNVTGEGLPLLKTFLNVVPANSAGRFPIDDELEVSISDCFSVPFVGTVVSGIILSGQVRVGDNVLIGPDSLGAFVPTAVKSIQRKRVNVEHGEAGQSVSFALKRIKRNAVRKGMVLLAKNESTAPPKAVRSFEGDVLVLYHNTLIAPNYQAHCHIGSVRQTVKIVEMDKPCLRTGDRAKVRFSFIKQAEFIRRGDRFLFREGRTRALGVVTNLL